MLSKGDCITFTSFDNDELITAKIRGFRNVGLTINSIFYNPWRGDRWGTTQHEIKIQGRAKGYLDPKSIIKLANCPTVVDSPSGGKRKSRKLIKRFRRNTRRQQRK